MNHLRLKCLIPLVTSVILASCGGSSTPETLADSATPVKPVGDSKTDVVTPGPSEDKVPDTVKPDTTTSDTMKPVVKSIPVNPSIPVLSLTFTPTKAFHFTWLTVPSATSYNIKEAITVDSGYSTIPIIDTADTTATSFDYVVPLYTRLNAKYILKSCNADGCSATSAAVFTSTKLADMVKSIGYFKASNTGANDRFGNRVSISANGDTLAVSAHLEDSDATGVGVNGHQTNNGALKSGAVYTFARSAATWSQQAYLKNSNASANGASAGTQFGSSVALSSDGDTLAVGAHYKSSNAIGVNAYKDNSSAYTSGAVYVY